MDRLRKGDILISGHGIVGALIGHAALMATDEWVLEMPGPVDNNQSSGGSSHCFSGIESNNRRISKEDWCSLHRNDTVEVYRCRYSDVAEEAADWAYRTYWNADGGSSKTQHITYKLTEKVRPIDPTYCSKLVLHSFYYGTGDRWVIQPLYLPHIIEPRNIPTYFWPKYRLNKVCTF